MMLIVTRIKGSSSDSDCCALYDFNQSSRYSKLKSEARKEGEAEASFSSKCTMEVLPELFLPTIKVVFCAIPVFFPSAL